MLYRLRAACLLAGGSGGQGGASTSTSTTVPLALEGVAGLRPILSIGGADGGAAAGPCSSPLTLTQLQGTGSSQPQVGAVMVCLYVARNAWALADKSLLPGD